MQFIPKRPRSISTVSASVCRFSWRAASLKKSHCKAAFNAAGNLMPLEIRWVDGTVFEIDKVTDIRQAAAMKAGG